MVNERPKLTAADVAVGDRVWYPFAGGDEGRMCVVVWIEATDPNFPDPAMLAPAVVELLVTDQDRAAFRDCVVGPARRPFTDAEILAELHRASLRPMMKLMSLPEGRWAFTREVFGPVERGAPTRYSDVHPSSLSGMLNAALAPVAGHLLRQFVEEMRKLDVQIDALDATSLDQAPRTIGEWAPVDDEGQDR